MRMPKLASAALTATLVFAGLLALPPVRAEAVAAGANGLMVFTSNRTGTRQVYVMQPSGAGQTALTSLGENFDPSVSADGTKVVFVSTRDGTNELYTMAIDGTMQKRITNNAITETHPVWAPNGMLIAFAGQSGTDSDIYAVHWNGGVLQDLTPNTPTFFDANPSWSPGGLTLAFDSTNRQGLGETNIYTILKTGTQLTQITHTGTDSNPSWAPDNKNLVFESRRDDPIPGPMMFASVSRPVSIGFTDTAMLVTQETKDQVLSVSSSGAVSIFATLPPTGNAQLERYLAVSPGLGGFPAGYVYVTVRKDILQISPNGTVTTFATITDLSNSNNFLTFDQVGTFGYKMILVGGQNSTVYTIDSTGASTLIADLSGVTSELEGSEVAPLSFSPYGGDLLAASKFDNTIYAITPPPTVTSSAAASWSSVEQALFVPPTPCNYGTSSSGFFVAMDTTGQIMKFPGNQFIGQGGTALTPGETTTDIGQLTSVGGSLVTSTFWGPIGTPDLEASAFAPCNPNNPPATAGGPTNIHEIYEMSSTGANQVRLTTNTFDDSHPAWSPNGQSIVFESDRDDPNQPGCEAGGTCINEIYVMSALNGSGQTNLSNNLAADDTAPDWETVSAVVNVADFTFSPAVVKPKQGGAVLWAFTGPSDHTATDNSGMGLFDSGTKSAGSSYVFQFQAAGSYPVVCTIHPQMTATVKVPTTVVPSSGPLATVFTVTWSAAFAPVGYVFDVQISRPNGSGFVDWKTNQTVKFATFTADAGVGAYQFQARLRNTNNGFASGYSLPVTITVTP